MPGTRTEVSRERCDMYCLATMPVRRQHRMVPSLTPPRLPSPTMPMSADTTTMLVSEVTRTFP